MQKVRAIYLFIPLIILLLFIAVGCVATEEISPMTPVPDVDTPPRSDYGAGVGCIWTGQCYRYPGKKKKEMQKDLSQCQAEATEAAKSKETKGTMSTYDIVSLTNQCMLIKGYIWR
jgi:hypothetical protein